MEKIPLNQKTKKIIIKTYTFDVTKYDKIFDLLLSDGQIVILKGLKTPPLEQRRKNGFCKFNNFFSHKTSQCVLFKDFVQNTLKDERRKFVDKQNTRLEEKADPKVEDALFVEPIDVFMVDITEST